MHKFVLALLKAEVRRRHARLVKAAPPARSVDARGATHYAGADFSEYQEIAELWARYEADNTPHIYWQATQADPLMAPDVVIGSLENPYLHRWHVVPRNEWPFGFLKRLSQRLGLPLAVQGAVKKFVDATTINIYFHHFLRSDDDRALHDHPWANMSWLLEGDYDEVVFETDPKGVVEGYEYNVPPTKRIPRKEGHFAFRHAERAHRVQLHKRKPMMMKRPVPLAGEEPVWTLFITGPKQRAWGFWCPKAWRHWESFVEFPKGDANSGVSQVGRGCD